MDSVFSAFDAIWGKLTHRPVTPYFKVFTDTGEPDGEGNITGNYSITPKDFFVEPPNGVNYLVISVDVFISLADNPALNSYGQLLGGLSNGLNFYWKRGNMLDLLNEFIGPIKTNGDLALFGAEINKFELLGVYDLYRMVFPVMREYGQPMLLRGDQNDRLIVRAQDDFTGLTVHKVIFRGMRQGIAKDKLL